MKLSIKSKEEILILFSKKATHHLRVIEEAIKARGEAVLLSNYYPLNFQVGEKIDQPPRLFLGERDLKEFKVIFFRTTGKRWEEANLIANYLRDNVKAGSVRIVDPVILEGRPYLAMKAYQMFAFQRAGLPVPRTIYGSLQFLKQVVGDRLGFPAVIKRSEGARGERVFLVQNQAQLNRLVDELLAQEQEEGKRFLAQEFVPNQGDLRILVLGNQVLGAIKRVRQRPDEFRNNVSRGGRAFAVKLTPFLEKIALSAAKIAQLSFAGVDIVLREEDDEPFLFEVNRSPQFKGFAAATGIDVADKIAQYLIKLKNQVKD